MTEPQAEAMPPLVTLAGVEIVAAGTWKLSSGEATFTAEDLASAIDAATCPSVGPPVIKIGHTDPRFDGEPAVGRVTNMELTAGGNKITGDLAGMPGWLGEAAASAYPNRSIEALRDVQCQQGHTHPFVITGLALLGVTPPGVGVLNGLEDVAALYGVTAANGHGEGVIVAMGSRVVAAGVTVDDVRKQYMQSAGYSMWIAEIQLSPPQLIVCDEATDKVYRVAMSIKAGAITFGDPVEVSVEYVDVPTAASAIAWAGRFVTQTYGGKVPEVVASFASREEAETIMGAWDGAAAQRNLGDSPSSSQIKALYAIPADTKSASKLPHHDVSSDGKVGAANPDGVSAAMAALNGGRGGLKGVSDSVKRSAYSHLAAHARGAGKTPPAYKGAASTAASKRAGRSLVRSRLIHTAAAAVDADDSVTELVAALDAVLDQASALAQAAGEDGLNPTAAQALDLITAAEQLADELMELLNIPDPDDDEIAAAASAHAAYTGTHSHAHPAMGSQGGDTTHDHSHSHSGSADHNHTHAGAGSATGPAKVKAATQQEDDMPFSDEVLAKLRERLGLEDDAELTGEEILAALGELEGEPEGEGEPKGKGKQPAKVAASRRLPPGAIVVEQEAWDGLQAAARKGEEALRRIQVGERDSVIQAAVSQGKFSPARAPHWSRLWDADPDGTREVIASLQRNVVPMYDIGAGGGSLDDDSVDDEFRHLFPPVPKAAG